MVLLKAGFIKLKNYFLYLQKKLCSNLITSAIIFGMIFMVSCVNDIDDVNNAAKLAEPGVERWGGFVHSSF